MNDQLWKRMAAYLFAMIFRLPEAVVNNDKISPRKKCEYACCYEEGKYVYEKVKRDMAIEEFIEFDKNAYAIKKEWEKTHIIIPKI